VKSRVNCDSFQIAPRRSNGRVKGEMPKGADDLTVANFAPTGKKSEIGWHLLLLLFLLLRLPHLWRAVFQIKFSFGPLWR